MMKTHGTVPEYKRLGGVPRLCRPLFHFPGHTLIYSGQESAMNKSLRFFDKDTIKWGTYPLQILYNLCSLKKTNKALKNGTLAAACKNPQ